MTFTIDPQLAADTFPLAQLSLSSVLLMNNRLFPWLILVPRVEGARDMADISAAERHQLSEEIHQASMVLRQVYSPYKLNVAALGNKVEMLHVHIIARFKEDAAWPEPVWGKGAEPYENKDKVIVPLRNAFFS